MLYVDAKVWLPDDLLMKADRMSMANGLEMRVPFLDHRLVEFAATLPETAKRGKAQLR
jgi:asparagine synthase (glutamine-hydrolysing)